MNRLLKLTTIAMVLVLILSMTGCGKKEAAAPQTGGTTVPSDGGETVDTSAQTDDTTVPTGEVESTAAPTDQEQPANQETSSEQEDYTELEDEIFVPDDEFFLEEEMGTGPLITVKWETYEAMSDAEKEAYRACFSNDFAFMEWEEMAFLDYEISLDDEMFLGMGSLNLKEIIESLTGKEFS